MLSENGTTIAGIMAMLLGLFAISAQDAWSRRVGRREDVSLQGVRRAWWGDALWAVAGLLRLDMAVLATNAVFAFRRSRLASQLQKGRQDIGNGKKHLLMFAMQLSIALVALALSLSPQIVEIGGVADGFYLALAEGVSSLAISVSLLAALPQLLKTVRGRRTAGISLASQAGYFLAAVFWCMNAYVTGRIGWLAASALNMSMLFPVLLLKAREVLGSGEGFYRSFLPEACALHQYLLEEVGEAICLFRKGLLPFLFFLKKC